MLDIVASKTSVGVSSWCCFPFSCNEDGGEDTMRETSSNKHPLAELEHHTYTAASTSTAKPNITLTNVPKSLALQISTGFSAPDDELASPCPTTAPCPHCPSSQERMDLEMSVLRRQDAVLKLQEEYYMLKLEMIKKQMQAPFSENWKSFCHIMRVDPSKKWTINLFNNRWIYKGAVLVCPLFTAGVWKEWRPEPWEPQWEQSPLLIKRGHKSVFFHARQ